jgi:anaerobic selenocysteine-containing dehydrogenase
MTNHWVDIKNADLVMVMGGNAAEAHPCGFKWVDRGEEGAQGQADHGRSALHPFRRRFRFLCAGACRQ